MKKLTLYCILLLMTSVVIGSCGGGGDDDPEPPTNPTNPNNPANPDPTPDGAAYLKLGDDRKEYGLGAQGSSVAFFVETNRPDYTVKSDVDWCHPEARGSQVWVTIDYWEDNTATQCREGHVMFYDGTSELFRLLVWQDARYAVFEVDHFSPPLYVSPAGGKYYIFVIKNTFRQWTLEASDDWFTVERSGPDGILITVKPRSSDVSTKREGYMIVTFNDDQRQRFKIMDTDDNSSITGEEPGYDEQTNWDN